MIGKIIRTTAILFFFPLLLLYGVIAEAHERWVAGYWPWGRL